MLEEGEDALHCRTWLLPCFKYFTFSPYVRQTFISNLINCFVSVVLFVVSLSVGIGNFRWADVLVMTLMFPAAGLMAQLMVPLVGIISAALLRRLRRLSRMSLYA